MDLLDQSQNIPENHLQSTPAPRQQRNMVPAPTPVIVAPQPRDRVPPAQTRQVPTPVRITTTPVEVQRRVVTETKETAPTPSLPRRWEEVCI